MSDKEEDLESETNRGVIASIYSRASFARASFAASEKNDDLNEYFSKYDVLWHLPPYRSLLFEKVCLPIVNHLLSKLRRGLSVQILDLSIGTENGNTLVAVDHIFKEIQKNDGKDYSDLITYFGIVNSDSDTIKIINEKSTCITKKIIFQGALNEKKFALKEEDKKQLLDCSIDAALIVNSLYELNMDEKKVFLKEIKKKLKNDSLFIVADPYKEKCTPQSIDNSVKNILIQSLKELSVEDGLNLFKEHSESLKDIILNNLQQLISSKNNNQLTLKEAYRLFEGQGYKILGKKEITGYADLDYLIHLVPIKEAPIVEQPKSKESGKKSPRNKKKHRSKSPNRKKSKSPERSPRDREKKERTPYVV